MMNTSRFLTPLFLVTMGTVAIAGDALLPQPVSKDRKQIACKLFGDEFAQRTSAIDQLIKGCEEVREVEDGYSFRFPGDLEWTERLIEFVKSERKCCSFFKFELTFEPDLGPIWLYVGGSAEAKSYINAMTK